MQKLFLSLIIAIVTFSMLITTAEAKRFGGGRSFGMQRSASSFSTNNNASRAQPMPNTMAAKPAAPTRNWLGPLAGLAIGGLLGSLFMSHGIGSGILSWLLIGGAIFLIWNLFRNRMQPAMQPPMQQPLQNMNFQNAEPLRSFAPAANHTIGFAIPGFDEAGFVRQAKALFIRLQAAYDTKNMSDIREFTTPEVFAEIQLQLQERGNDNNVTEVLSIDAQLLAAASEHRAINTSVRFTGLIQEEVGMEPVSVNEIWHFRKDDFKPNWAVSGIQQA